VSNTSRQHESCEKGRNAAGLDGRKDARLEASIERKRKVNIKRGRTHCKGSKQQMSKRIRKQESRQVKKSA
jgi:hypothetical protein